MSDLPEGAGAPEEDEELLGGAIEDETELEPGEEPAEEPIEPDPEAGPEPRQTRQERRDDRARGRARELEQQNADLARRLATLEQQRTQPAVDPAAQAREEAAFRESLQTMLPHEAAIATAERLERRMQAQLMQAELRGFDRSDMAEFNTLKARDRAAERLAPQIEQALAAERASGNFRFGRLDIFDFLRGRELRTRGPVAARTQRQAGAARVARETTRPASGRGDVARGAGQGRDQDAADEALLRRVRAEDG